MTVKTHQFQNLAFSGPKNAAGMWLMAKMQQKCSVECKKKTLSCKHPLMFQKLGYLMFTTVILIFKFFKLLHQIQRFQS